MMAEKSGTSAFPKDIRGLGIYFMALGSFLALLGATMIFLPAAATFAVDLLLGFVFIASGVAQMALAFKARGWGGFAIVLLAGIVSALAGLVMLLNPVVGVIALTLLLGGFLVAVGVLRFVLALRMRPMASWAFMMLGSAAALLLGALVLAGWPSDSLIVLGILAGINLLFDGLAFVLLALVAGEGKFAGV